MDKEPKLILEKSAIYDTSYDDIFYNKIPLDNGDINLCFIIGLSGSGKSTMGNEYRGKTRREVLDVDKILLHGALNKDDEYFKQYGDFAYNFMVKGPGKRFRTDMSAVSAARGTIRPLQVSFTHDLFKEAVKYAKAHRSIRLILEGVYFYRFMEPSQFRPYAVFIKGRSFKVSTKAAFNRNKHSDKAIFKQSGIKGKIIDALQYGDKYIDIIDGSIQKFIDYYKPLYEKQLETMKTNQLKTSINDLKNLDHDKKLATAKKNIRASIQDAKDDIKLNKETNLHTVHDNLKALTKESLEDRILANNSSDFSTIMENYNIKNSIYNIALLRSRLKYLQESDITDVNIISTKRDIIYESRVLNELLDKSDIDKDIISTFKKVAITEACK